MTQKLQNLLVVLGLIAVAGIGYYLFTQNGNISLNNNLVDNQSAAETAQFLSKLNELKRIDLDGSLFLDDRFTTLVDAGTTVIPLPIGKDNPFIEGN